MIITDQMVDAALNNYWERTDTGHKANMRAAITAALAVSGYGEVVEAFSRQLAYYEDWTILLRKALVDCTDTADAILRGQHSGWVKSIADLRDRSRTALSHLPTNPDVARDIVSQGN